MLGRKLAGSASFVCLRCRLQLASAPKRLPFPVTSIAPPSRPSLRRYASTQSDPSGSSGVNESGDDIRAEITNQSDLEPRAEPERDTTGRGEGYGIIPSPPSAPPPSKNRTLYASRGHLVAPEQEGLSIDILGKPGSAIVLREKRVLKRQRPLPKLDSDDANARVDPASLLSTEDTDPTSDDILLNIHELKPKETRILSDKQFNKLKDTLVGGFTNAQLAHYIGEYQRIRQLRPEDESASEAPPWVVERCPWVPFVPNAVGAVDPVLEGYITKAMTPKKRLAIRIMRECWDVSNQKVLEQDGYLELRLRDAEFSLLTLGNRRWLEGTPRAIMSRVKQVKLIRESRMVSIVAPKHAAESILDRINDVLSKARTSDFDVALVSPNPLEPGVLEEVGRMTNTLTRLDPSGKKVVVTWIHMAQRDEVLENSGETVFRFLRDAYGPKPHMSTTLRVVPDDCVRGGRYLPEIGAAEKLSWQERFGKWHRWTVAVPQSKKAVKAQAQEALIPADILPFNPTAEEVAEQPANPIDDTPGWSTDLQTDTSAIFGHVVFARQDQHPVPPAAESTLQLDTSLPRTFVPILPALGSLNLPTNLREEGLWHSTIVIRFSPSPDNTSPDFITSAPTLELRIEADHTEIKRLASLRAIKDTFTGDVLFPAAHVDARLVQQRYFTLPGPSIERHVPSIITFLSKSDLRPWEGKLSTPPVLLSVHLPRRLLSSSSSSPSTTSGTNPSETNPFETNANPTEEVEIAYNLAAIEVHRTVAAEYEGLKLRYSSIQAGQRGGERSELSLDAVRVERQDYEEDARSALAFGDEEEAGGLGGIDSDPYEIVDADKFRAQMLSHSMNDPNRRPPAPKKPAELEDFVRVASGIVNEQGLLRWHAKRS